VIRRLRAGDEALLQELCRRFKERVPTEEESHRFLARQDIATFVWLEGADPVGFAYGYLLLRIDGDRSVFFYELDVAEPHRRRGIGRALAEEMRAVAQSVGATKMWVETDEENEAAKRTYASAGASRTGDNVLFTWRFTD
jgi:ribosomal protein S18 acetylase RimI-like enzyme